MHRRPAPATGPPARVAARAHDRAGAGVRAAQPLPGAVRDGEFPPAAAAARAPAPSGAARPGTPRPPPGLWAGRRQKPARTAAPAAPPPMPRPARAARLRPCPQPRPAAASPAAVPSRARGAVLPRSTGAPARPGRCNAKGADSLLGSKVKLGADASAVAGPVGRAAEASTDVAMRAEILSYSRSRGDRKSV